MSSNSGDADEMRNIFAKQSTDPAVTTSVVFRMFHHDVRRSFARMHKSGQLELTVENSSKCGERLNYMYTDVTLSVT